MKISELIEDLEIALREHGDLDVVSGVLRTGYGEPVEYTTVPDNTLDIEGNQREVLDLVLSESSDVAQGGF